jgi:hypothetical protein
MEDLAEDTIKAREEITDLIMPSAADRFVFVNTTKSDDFYYFLLKNIRALVGRVGQPIS